MASRHEPFATRLEHRLAELTMLHAVCHTAPANKHNKIDKQQNLGLQEQYHE